MIVNDYFSFLKGKPFKVKLRSIYWNAFTSSRTSIKNLSSLLYDNNAKFTFFVSGRLAHPHQDFINNLKNQNHEIASHGFFHKSYRMMSQEDARNDLIRSINAFDSIGIKINGFRAPHLDFSEKEIPLLSGTGIKYTSNGTSYDFKGHYSTAKRYTKGMHRIDKDIVEIPISAPDDWIPIVLNGITDHDKLFNIWKEYLVPGSVFLLHPMRIGHRKFIKVTESLLKESEYEFITLSEMMAGKKGIALTGDVGKI